MSDENAIAGEAQPEGQGGLDLSRLGASGIVSTIRGYRRTRDLLMQPLYLVPLVMIVGAMVMLLVARASGSSGGAADGGSTQQAARDRIATETREAIWAEVVATARETIRAEVIATITGEAPTGTPTSTLTPTTTATSTPTATTTASLTPTATLTPTVTATPTPIIYVVQAGDSLSEIAGEFGVTVEDLAMANDIADPARISIGKVLKIPPPR